MLRLVRLGLHLAVGAVLATVLTRPRRWPGPPAAVVGWWHRRACRILGVRVRVTGAVPHGPVLLVCNHVSWLDIPVLASVLPGCFVSKAEVRDWPLIGWLAARAGTLFLQRGHRGAASEIRERMAWTLRRGWPVILFPEGTTTDGTHVRRFYARLFDAAVLAGAPVQPVAIRFSSGDRPSQTAPFIGDDAFVPHLLRLAGGPPVVANLTFLEPIPTAVGRDGLASAAEASVRAIVEGAPAAAGAGQG